jgi:hypothetical protein
MARKPKVIGERKITFAGQEAVVHVYASNPVPEVEHVIPARDDSRTPWQKERQHAHR